MAHRLVGSAATFAYYAFFSQRKPRNPQLRRTADILLAIYSIFSAVQLVESPEDRQAFTTFIPGGSVSVYIAVLLTCVTVMACIANLFVYDVMQLFVFVVLLRTIVVDCRLNYWMTKHRVDFWNQFRLCADNFCVALGILMYLSCTKSPVHFKETTETIKDK